MSCTVADVAVHHPVDRQAEIPQVEQGGLAVIDVGATLLSRSAGELHPMLGGQGVDLGERPA